MVFYFLRNFCGRKNFNVIDSTRTNDSIEAFGTITCESKLEIGWVCGRKMQECEWKSLMCATHISILFWRIFKAFLTTTLSACTIQSACTEHTYTRIGKSGFFCGGIRIGKRLKLVWPIVSPHHRVCVTTWARGHQTTISRYLHSTHKLKLNIS